MNEQGVQPLNGPAHLAWAEIHLDNLRKNVENIRRLCSNKQKIMAVLKADGYGHGAVKIALFLQRLGIDAFAVANVDEAVLLRKNGITIPILILGIVPCGQMEDIFRYQLTPTVCTLETAQELSRAASARQMVLSVHVRVDIGLGSIGVLPHQCVPFVEAVAGLPNLALEGIYTHLTTAYQEDDHGVQRDLQTFDSLLLRLRQKGIDVPLVHVASSPAILRYPQAHYQMVRAGIILYGLPATHAPSPLPFYPVMTLKSKVVFIKDVGEGETVGYVHGYRLNRRTRVATVPFGYGDALFFFYLNGGEVLLHGRRAPILGRPMMDHFMVDVSHIPEVKVGDEVVIIGQQGKAVLTAEEMAERAGIGRLNADCVCMLTQRVPRIYIDSRGFEERRDEG